MNPTLKRYAVSSLITFVAAFCGAIALQLTAGAPVELTATFLFGILGVAGRAAIKALIESIPSLKTA